MQPGRKPEITPAMMEQRTVRNDWSGMATVSHEKNTERTSSREIHETHESIVCFNLSGCWMIDRFC